tara:strand:+ start:1543 stop:2016 length:474 start_codon:yes stop_codon:yes gene_type:complete
MDINATLLIEMVIFLTFFMITKHYIWPPIVEALDARREIINTGLKKADEARHHLEKANADAEQIIHEAAVKAKKIIHDAQKEAAEMITSAQKSCHERLNKLDKELDVKRKQAEKNAQKHIESQMLALATEVCKKALVGSLDQKTTTQLIQAQTGIKN